MRHVVLPGDREMLGFEERFRDFPDYLATATQEAWEGPGRSAAIDRVYHPAVIQRDARGVAQGAGALMAADWPLAMGLTDRRMLTEDVIWNGSDRRGFIGSQRLVMTGRHTGPGPLGAASGARVRVRVMADRFAKQNRISDEWQVMDTAALMAQIGQAPQAWARAQLDAGFADEPAYCPEVDVPGPYTGQGNDATWGLAFEQVLRSILGGGWDDIPQHYDRACQLAYPGGAQAHGWRAAESFWLGLRAALPDAQFTVHHRIGLEEPMLPPRAALRWSLTGRHAGWGAFGRPTDAWVHVMGLSHAEFGPEGLRREWTLFDAVAVWMQIVAMEG